MKCPHCQAEIPETCRYCTECGADLGIPIDTAQRRKTVKLAGGAGLALGQAARRARLEASYDPEALIGDRAYNAIMLGVLLWGLLVNYLLCLYVGDALRAVNPLVFLLGYMICAFVGIRIAARSQKPLISFLGYNLVVVPFGLVISVMVEAYGGIHSTVVRDAFVYTMLITGGMGAIVMIVRALKLKDGNKNAFTLSLVLGIVCLVLAVVVFVHPVLLANVMVQTAGVSMIVEGVSLLIALSRAA